MMVLFILLSLLVVGFVDGEFPAGFGCTNTGYLTFGVTRKRQVHSPKGKYNDIPVQHMKAHGGVEAQLHLFLTAALGAVSHEHHALAASSPG